MRPIRVHLGTMPRMLRAMVSDLLTSEPDMTVVGSTTNDAESLRQAHAERADIIIEQEQESLEDTCTAAVLSGAPAAILAVGVDGQRGLGVSMVRRSVNIGTDGSTLADVVRALLRSSKSIDLETEVPREA